MKRLLKKGLSVLGALVMTAVMIPTGAWMATAEEQPAFADVPQGYTLQPVGTVEELAAIKTGSKASQMYYYLTNDIVMEAASFKGIGTNENTDAFFDILNGNGYAIEFAGPDGQGVALNGSGTWNGGLFFSMNGDAVVENLTLKGAITSTAQSTGALVGHMVNGTIDRCTNYASVTASGKEGVGGLAGRVTQGIVMNCMNYGAITGGNLTGGLVGKASYATKDINAVSVANCANFGSVTGKEKVGGILGLGQADRTYTIENCYNVGNISETSGVGRVGAIVCSAWPGAVKTVNCYALEGSSPKFLNTTTKMSESDMQAQAFADTLNANVAAGIVFADGVSNTQVTLPAAGWQYTENGYPVVDATLIPTVRPVVKVACVGDSITAGNGASSTSKNYVSQLQTLLGSRYAIQNFGNSGKTLLSGLTDSYDQTTEYQASQDLEPDVVTIMLGTNDSKAAYWDAAAYERQLGDMVQMYRALPSHPIVILATSPTVYDDGDGNWGITDAVVTNEVAPIQRRVAEEMQCVLVDTNAGTRGWLDTPESYLSDGVHPTDAGYAVLAQLFADGITDASCRIHGFSVAGQEAAIDHETNTITLEKTEGVNWSAQTPVVTVMTGAEITPEGEQNFTLSLTYMVESPDLKTTRTYTVTVVEPEEEYPVIPEGYTAVPISTAAELKTMETGSAAKGNYYYLTDNITITENWTPLGGDETTNAFYDILDGCGYTITFAGANGSGVNMGSGWNGGLFFAMNGDAVVKNLNTAGIITSSRQSTGAIVGQMVSGTIDHCVNYADVTVNTNYAGGLAGRAAQGAVVNCMNYGTVIGKEQTGGVVGCASYSTAMTDEEKAAGVVKLYIANCANFGAVTGTAKYGGVLGLASQNKTFRVENCYNAGLVSGGNADSVGAVVCAWWTAAVNVTDIYALEGSCNRMNLTTVLTQEQMQAEDFWNTLNTHVENGLSYINELDGEPITVSASRWRYVEGGYPVVSNGIVVKATGRYGEPLFEREVSSTAALKALAGSAKVPALGGYEFVGWNEPLDADAYARVYDTLSQVLELTPVYEVDENGSVYSLAIENADARDGFGQPMTAGIFDQRVEVTGADTTKTVAYWELDGAKVGFGQNTYQFYISGNNTIKAVYDDAAPTDPAVVLQQATASGNGENHYLTVVAQTSIPSGYTLTSCGVMYTGAVSVLKNLEANPTTVDESTYVQVASGKTANQQYMTHLLNVKSGKTRYARAYAVVTDAEGSTLMLWSSTVIQFKTAADGVVVVRGSI